MFIIVARGESVLAEDKLHFEGWMQGIAALPHPA